MVNLVKSTGLLLLAALFLASCSKSSSTGPGGTAPTLTSPTFSGPSTTSASSDTSYGAVFAKGAATLFNATASGFMGFYSGTAAQSGNSWNWTYSAGGFSAKWTATSSGSGYDWKLVFNGGPYQGVTYNNWTALSGNESTDGKTGSWTIYYQTTTTVAYQVSWSTASNGTLTGKVVANDSSGTLEGKDEFTNNTDKSGELKVYTGSVVTLDVKWNADGSGTWTEYDDTGTEIGSGSWT